MGLCVCKYNPLTVLWKVQCYGFYLDYFAQMSKNLCDVTAISMCIQAICHRNTHFMKTTAGRTNRKVTKKKKKLLTQRAFISSSYLSCEFDGSPKHFHIKHMSMAEEEVVKDIKCLPAYQKNPAIITALLQLRPVD